MQMGPYRGTAPNFCSKDARLAGGESRGLGMITESGMLASATPFAI